MIKGERIHYFKATHPKCVLTAFFQRDIGIHRAEILIQNERGVLLKRIVHKDQIEKWRPERAENGELSH